MGRRLPRRNSRHAQVPRARRRSYGESRAQHESVAGTPTCSRQFFITYSRQPHLDGKYTIFGKVIDGAELGGTLDAMEKVPVDAKHRPLQDIRMQGVTIHANPIAHNAATD
jgi:peptidyl-prolyl cis-trans isomerase-like 3